MLIPDQLLLLHKCAAPLAAFVAVVGGGCCYLTV